VTELARQLAAKRFQLILHHHWPEMAEGAREWRHLLRNTELPLCMDIDWVRRGGEDPLALLAEAGGRVRSLHLRNSRQGVWSEDLSDGDVDYRKVADYLKKHSYSGYLVVELAYQRETPITESVEEDLRRSREYVRDVFSVDG
jgi:inosose dehydratase